MKISEIRQRLDYIPLSGKLLWRFRTDSGPGAKRFNTKYGGKEAFTSASSNGYKKGCMDGKTWLAHRVVWAWVYGEWPEQIDHINGDKSDNRLSNLRAVSAGANQRNRPRSKNNTTGRTGVYWEPRRKKWRADITKGRKTITLGRFQNKADAIAARSAAEVEMGFHKNHDRVA